MHKSEIGVGVYDDISGLIGNTPLVKINKTSFEANARVQIFAKLECFNPGFSVKDRIALAMIEDAEEKGILNHNKTIIEPTSGNTGIGLALICALKGYQLVLVMPESMSLERRKMLAHAGATIILTAAPLGMMGAINKAKELLTTDAGKYVMLDQFSNAANPAIHRKTTAEEIWRALDGKIDYFVSGVGTGGTITGVGQVLKQRNPEIKVIAVEPAESAVLSGCAPSPHKIQGIGAGFKPQILDLNVIDKVITVTSDEAISAAKDLALKEGILVGISSGAAYVGASKIAAEIVAKSIRPQTRDRGVSIVTIFADTCERYLSTDLFNI